MIVRVHHDVQGKGPTISHPSRTDRRRIVVGLDDDPHGPQGRAAKHQHSQQQTQPLHDQTFLSLLFFFAGQHRPLHLGFVSSASALLFSSLLFSLLRGSADANASGTNRQPKRPRTWRSNSREKPVTAVLYVPLLLLSRRLTERSVPPWGRSIRPGKPTVAYQKGPSKSRPKPKADVPALEPGSGSRPALGMPRAISPPATVRRRDPVVC